MLKIAICEDEKYILKKLFEKVEKYTKEKHLQAHIHTYISGEELLKETINFDIVLLDMILPGIKGLEVAKKLCNKSSIIFITSYGEYALDAFEIDAVHYLLKPVTQEHLYSALDRAVYRLEQADNKSLIFEKAGKTQVIPLHDILYGEVFNHQIYIHTVQGTYDYPGTLNGLEKELDERFFRCHRSVILNMRHIVGQEKGMAMISNGDKLFVSRRKQAEFMEKLLQYLKKEVI